MKKRINSRSLAKIKPQDKPYEITDDQLPGFIVRVQPTGLLIFYYRYTWKDGSKKRVPIGSVKEGWTAEEARNKAKDHQAEIRKGVDPLESMKAAESDTLGKFIEGRYWQDHLKHKKTGDEVLKRLKTCFAEFWNRPLKDPKIGFAIVNWRGKRLEAGRAKSTINRDIGALKSVFARAVDWELVPKHPLPPRLLKPEKERRKGKVRYLNADEEKRLLDALDAREERIRQERERFNVWRAERGYALFPDLRQVSFADHLKPMVVLSLHTGMRRGELFGLDWDDIDFGTAILTVRAETAKDEETRHIPLNVVALSTLQMWKEQTDGEGYVFKSPTTGGRFDNVNKAWRVLLDKEHAKISRFRWHDMRHHFASKLVMAGESLNTVRELLGHSTIEMTLRYAHLEPQVKAAAVAKLVAPDNVIQLNREAMPGGAGAKA